MNIKDWFKSKPYWLKGGIIGLLLILLIFIANLLLGLPHPLQGEGSMFLFLYASLPFVKVFFIFDRLPYSYAFAFTLYVLSTFLGYFIVGAAIGFIVGKIKSKNK